METSHFLLRKTLLAGGLLLLLAGAGVPAAGASRMNQASLESYILILSDPAGIEAASRVGQKYQPQLQALSRALRGVAPATPQGGDGGVSEGVQALAEVKRQMRQELLEASAAARAASQSAAEQAVAALGGEVVYRYQVLNALAVRLPKGQRAALQALPGVEEVVEDRALQPVLNISVPTILNGSSASWAPYRGAGTRIAVIDTGITTGHPALDEHTYLQRVCLNSGGSVWDPNDPSNTGDNHGHGTHIAGILASEDSTYKGVAYNLDVLINAKAGYALYYGGPGVMQESDSMACADWAVSPAVGADVLNLSWGGEAELNDPLERFWDALVDQWDAVAAIAAGNNGPNPGTLGSPAGAYNVLTVANVNDYNNSLRSDDFINTSSSRGPTLDGRKKPDLSAPGTSILSTDAFSSGFVSYSGTSMAAPHVAGAAALLISRGVASPMAVKALLINNAQEKGDPVGWDPAYGWGYLDLNETSLHINDYFLGSVGPSPAFHLYAGLAYGIPPYYPQRATLVWHRRAVYNGSSTPTTTYTLTNLDLYAYDEATNAQLEASTSAIDNVEQVIFHDTYPSAVLKVDAASSSIAGAASEDYALATKYDFTPRNGPAFHFPSSVEGDLSGPAGTVITLTVNLRNLGDLKGFNINVDLQPGPGLATLSGPSTPLGAPDLNAGETAALGTWTFSKGDSNRAYFIFTAASNSYGETFQSLDLIGGYEMNLPLIGR
ncbi:MAG: S8 family serine peptidase [Anaerolineales bacterium]|nr:S8 family serine peptidase [Anaerolineales bacterium]